MVKEGSVSAQRYLIEVTAEQARVFQDAAELMARLSSGQLNFLRENLPIKDNPDCSALHDDLDQVERILSRHLDRSSGHRMRESSQIAWDLYQVVRHRLAWDQAKEEGLLNPDGSRNWHISAMMGVRYDEPMRTGSQPLAKVTLSDQTD